MNAGLRSPRRLPSLGRSASWLKRPEVIVIVVLLLVGALLRPALAMVPEPIAVAPQYARSAMTLYMVLDKPGYVVPIARRIDEAQVSPRNAVAELLAGPEAGPDLVSPFAPGATLTSFGLEGGRASVSLSAGALDGTDRERAVDALVLTLTEFPRISSVSVRVGDEHLDEEGFASDEAVEMTRPAPNPETPQARAGGTELYFAYAGVDRYLVPVTRSSSPGEQGPSEQGPGEQGPSMAMAELLAGPVAGSHLEAVLPSDVRVLDVRVEDGLATVNFNPNLVYAYRLSKANAMFVRKAVMATLTGLPGIAAGLIEIDGSRLLLYTCVNVTQEFPQTRPWAINDEFYLDTLSRPDQLAA